MTMKLFSLLTIGLGAASATVTTETTSMLRGSKVVHRRTVHPGLTEEGLKPDNRNKPDQLVDTPNHRHYVKLRGTASNGEEREVTVDLDQLNEVVPHNSELLKQNNRKFRDDARQPNIPKVSRSDLTHKRRNERQQRHSGHQETRDHHAAEHERHYRHHQKQHQQQPEKPEKSKDPQKKQIYDKSTYALPPGLAGRFNETLFDELHTAPFDLYAEALGHELDEDESFPVFSVPAWHETPGVFSAFSKQAEALIFENAQFLLSWEDIEGASTVSSAPLLQFIADNGFKSSLIIGKSYRDKTKTVSFLGLVVSYYQYGAQKNVLVPFGRLEDFFDETSEQHLSDPETKHLEAEALQELLEQKRTNSTDFYHPAFAHSQERKEQLEDLEIIHFQKLYQLLIRRSFLFSFGYADCLLTEPEHLRECLDDTFYSVVKLETNVRGALNDEIVHALAEINEEFHSKIKEACISFQGGIIGTGGCTDTNDLTAFVTAVGSL